MNMPHTEICSIKLSNSLVTKLDEQQLINKLQKEKKNCNDRGLYSTHSFKNFTLYFSHIFCDIECNFKFNTYE